MTTWSADPEQAGLTASAVQLWPQTIRLCSVRKLPFCLFCYLFLHLPEGVLVDDGRISVSSGIAGIFQHPFDFVLVPERRLLGEGDIVRIQLVCQRLISSMTSIVLGTREVFILTWRIWPGRATTSRTTSARMG